MRARIKLQKSLMLLDRGEMARSEQGVREAIGLAEAEGDRTTLVTSLCVLGDLLWQEGRAADAIPFLERAIGEGAELAASDYEVGRAAEILSKIRN